MTGLPPGTYQVSAELKGLKTVVRDGIIVQTGQVVTINLKTEPSAISEIITVQATSPTVDVQSTKIGGVLTSDMIQRLPLNRNLINIFNTVAGANGTIQTYSGSIHGGSPTTIPFEVDGVNSNDPTHNGLLLATPYDAMEEIEITTGGLPAQIGNTGGSFVNIVTKSGGNEFHGLLQAYHTQEKLNQMLFSDEQLRALGIGKPTFAIYDWDLSAMLGGPIFKDKLWFYGNVSFKKNEFHSVFIPTAINGKQYDQYPDPQTQLDSFLKLTTQINKNLRFFMMFNASVLNRDVYAGGGARATFENTFTLKNNTWISTTGNLTWLMDSNTFIDLRAGYSNRWYPITQREEFAKNVTYWDRYTDYRWGSVDSQESYITRRTIQSSARFTHFQDSFLGGDHEFGVGVEWQHGLDRYGYARENPMSINLYNGNLYYYRGYYSLSGPHPTFGDGRLSFTNCGRNDGDSWKDLLENRLSAYIQDAWTIKNRLTINVGLRMDFYDGWGGDATTTGIDGLPYKIGEYFKPQLDTLYGAGNGFNPWGAFKLAPIKDALNFTTWSPRIGATYDIFGDGKTAVKAAFSRYAEAVPVMWFSAVSPAVYARYDVNWFDLNSNGIPDDPGVDSYTPTNGLGQFTRPDPAYLKSRLDPNMTTPIYNEFVASINHELFRNFALKLQYIYKHGTNLHGSKLYDKATGRYWYKTGQAPEWWVPFTTTVPAVGQYAAQSVTLYYMSNNSPWNNTFSIDTLLEEGKRDYNALEVTFDKRYADGWSLGGSVVLSKLTQFGGGGGSPNNYINAYGRAGEDIPFAVKLYGTFSLPSGFVGSFFFRHVSGTPYARSISVAPPADWATANNVYPSTMGVNLEIPGVRRNPDYDNLDIRLEKEFTFKFGKFGVFIDVFNVLGNQYLTIGQNPGGTWRPTANNTDQGAYTMASTYGKVTALSGVRTFKFSARFTF